MNERIKELAEQAEKLSLQYANKNNINFVDAFNIVFAELIVKECMNLIKAEPQDGDTINCISNLAIMKLEKHFGVK